jgi:hypothetical protein
MSDDETTTAVEFDGATRAAGEDGNLIRDGGYR